MTGGGTTMPEGSDQRRRAAQASADELARMGIDPGALGLGPATPSAGSPPHPEAPPHPAPLVNPVPDGAAAPLVPPDGSAPQPPDAAARPAPAPSAAAWVTLARIAEPAPQPPPDWRHHLRATALGVLQPGAASAVEREQDLVAQVRTRRPEPRTVAFLAGKGGVGTTTTAAAVALTLATLRSDSVALVSARSGTGSLGHRLAGAPAPAVASLASGQATQLGRAHDRLAVVDGSPWYSPTRAQELRRLLSELRVGHPLTLVDVGNDLGEAAQTGLTDADQVVVVTTASHDAVDATRVALSRVHQADPFRLSTVVVALTSLHPRQSRRTARRLRLALGPVSPLLVPVPYDPALATGHPLELGHARPATREAYLRLAGLVAAPGQSQAWFSRPASTPAGR